MADMTVQQALVEFFDAEPPDVVRAGVLDRIQRIEIVLADSTHSAHCVADKLRLRVMPHQLRIDLHAWEPKLVDGHARDLLVGERDAQRHRFVRPACALEPLAERGHVFVRQADKLLQRSQRVLQLGDALAHDRQTENRHVVRQQPAVAIHDPTAGRRHRPQLNAVVLGQRCVARVLDDLQLHQAHDQHAQQYNHRGENRQHAEHNRALLLIGIR